MRIYPQLEDIMVETGLRDVKTYIYHHQNTVAQFIATSLIIYLCMAVKRRPGQRFPSGGGNRTGWMWRR